MRRMFWAGWARAARDTNGRPATVWMRVRRVTVIGASINEKGVSHATLFVLNCPRALQGKSGGPGRRRSAGAPPQPEEQREQAGERRERGSHHGPERDLVPPGVDDGGMRHRG